MVESVSEKNAQNDPPRPRLFARSRDPKLERTEGKDPRWYIRWKTDEDSSPRRHYLGRVSECDQAEAIARKRELLAVLDDRRVPLPSDVTFGSLAAEYTRTVLDARDTLAESTRSKYRRHLKNHLLPEFAGVSIARIDTRAIDAWLARKAAAGLAPYTIADLKNLLSALFEQGPPLEACRSQSRA